VKVVCDTNVLIAGLVADGLCRDIVKRRLLGIELFTSQVLLDELYDKLRDKFEIEPKELPIISAYKEKVILVSPSPLPTKRVCRDPDDDEVLATAIAAKADIILTGDDDLLILKEYHKIRILSPRQFVEFIDRRSP
jgi:uncharacterized protein